jgi:hypothetical protein
MSEVLGLIFAIYPTWFVVAWVTESSMLDRCNQHFAFATALVLTALTLVGSTAIFSLILKSFSAESR